MASLKDQLRRMTEYLDKSRPSVERITVNCTRRTAMRAGARPKERGGELRYGGRMIVYTKLTELEQRRRAPFNQQVSDE